MRRVADCAVRAAIWLLSALIVTGCAVREWPEMDYSNADFTLHLDFAEEMPLYREIVYTRTDSATRVVNESRTAPPAHDIRYTIRAFRNNGSREAERTFVFTRPSGEGLDCTTVLQLDEGTYDIYVWADYVAPDDMSDRYYDTSDFGAVTLADRDNHQGSNDYRDAFRGSVTATVVHPYRYLATDKVAENEATAVMARPMGRYEFVSTDVDTFLSRVIAMRGGDNATDETRSVDLSDFYVVFSYNAYMPSVFNMFTDKPSDSWTGMSYTSRMSLGDDGMSLGFDYIFVNGTETLMNINVDIYTKEGELISSTKSVEVPIVRSKLTLVKGEFLTAYGSGGVTVNPDFDGPDFNIEIK